MKTTEKVEQILKVLKQDDKLEILKQPNELVGEETLSIHIYVSERRASISMERTKSGFGTGGIKTEETEVLEKPENETDDEDEITIM